MQNAKDSFYEVLRARLAALNPERTVVVRGVTRPALVVDENETASVAEMPDCFHLRWGKTEVVQAGAWPQVSQLCEVWYATAGSPWNGGIDRGRLLAAMDGELLQAIMTAPQQAPKNSYAALTNGGQVIAMRSQIWWSDVSFTAEQVKADRVTRLAQLTVISFQEAGEL